MSDGECGDGDLFNVHKGRKRGGELKEEEGKDDRNRKIILF